MPIPDRGPPLLGASFFGQYGIQSSASRAHFNDKEAVIFGAPDPTAETGLGSARLSALDMQTGKVIWASDVVAHVSGCTSGNLTELYERIAYSSPPVHEGKVYVGVHDYGDDSIQNGKVVAVDPRATILVLLTAVGLFWPAAAAQEKKAEKHSVADRSQIEVITRFAGTLRIPKGKEAAVPLRVECKQWYGTREEQGAEFPQQGFYVAQLLAGVITAEIDGKPAQHVPGDFRIVEKGSRMVVKMKLHRETAIILTIAVSPLGEQTLPPKEKGQDRSPALQSG